MWDRAQVPLPLFSPGAQEPSDHDTFFSALEREFVDSWKSNVVHGTPDQVRSGLDDLQKRTGADELMLTAHAHSADVRLRSYELIADAYDLA